MSRLPPIPDPLDCVLFDAGDTLLAPAPSFQGRFVAVATAAGLPLEEAAVDAAIAEAVRAVEWPSDWTDPATQRSFWVGFYRQVLAALGHEGMEGSGEPLGGAPVDRGLRRTTRSPRAGGRTSGATAIRWPGPRVGRMLPPLTSIGSSRARRTARAAATTATIARPPTMAVVLRMAGSSRVTGVRRK